MEILQERNIRIGERGSSSFQQQNAVVLWQGGSEGAPRRAAANDDVVKRAVSALDVPIG